MAISFKPSEAISGGLPQDINVRITHARAAVYNYNGKAQQNSLAVHLTMEPTEGGEVMEQYYSAGSLTYLAPSDAVDGDPMTDLGDEGRFVVPAEGSSATQISKSTNFVFFMQELCNAGLKEDQIKDDLSFLEGFEVHVMRKAPPKREGLQQSTDQTTAPARVNTVLVPSKILKYPWDNAKGGKTKTAAASAGSGARGSVDVNGITLTAIAGVLGKQESVTPNDAKKLAFPVLLKDKSVNAADRNSALANILDETWLEANQGEVFGFDGSNIVRV